MDQKWLRQILRRCGQGPGARSAGADRIARREQLLIKVS